MQRVLVMGPPGSGKSTVARYLGQKHRLPVFHLDQFYHQPGWGSPAPEIFQAEVERIAMLPEWVIDGNFTDTIAPRFAAADTLFYLDMPVWLSMFRIARRTITQYGRVRADMPEGCPEHFDPEFLHFAWTWNRTRRARHLALLGDFSGKKIILRGGRQQKRLLNGQDMEVASERNSA